MYNVLCRYLRYVARYGFRKKGLIKLKVALKNAAKIG